MGTVQYVVYVGERPDWEKRKNPDFEPKRLVLSRPAGCRREKTGLDWR